MAGAMDFFDDAIQFGKDLGKDALEFVKDVELKDIETIASIGVGAAAIHQAFDKPDAPPGLDDTQSAADSLKAGAELATSFTESTRADIGEQEGEGKANREATKNRLRVRRTSGTGSSTGLNPLAIQI